MVEWDAERVELGLMPAGADTQGEAPLTDLVERDGHFGEHCRIAERRAYDHRPELHPAGCLRERGQDGPTLPDAVSPATWPAIQEMVVKPDRVETDAVFQVQRHLTHGRIPGCLAVLGESTEPNDRTDSHPHRLDESRLK